MNFKNLKEARIKKSMTMKQTADFLGISVNTYQKYEYGQREPNGDTIVALATLFDVSTDYLLGKPESQQPEKPIDLLIKEQSLQGVEEALLRMYFKLDRKKRAEFLQSMFEDVQKNLFNQQNKNDDEYETIIIETTPEKLRADLNRAEEEQRNSQKDVS